MSETFSKRLLVSLCGLQLIAITLMAVFPGQALTLLLKAMGIGLVSVIFVLRSRKSDVDSDKSPVASLIVLSVLVLATIGVYVFFMPGSV